MRGRAYCFALCVVSAAFLIREQAAAAAAAGGQERADPTLDIQLFQPTAGSTGLFTTESGEVMSHLGISAGLVLNYARKPLSVRIVEGDDTERDVGAVIKNRLDCVLLGAVGLFDIGELGIAVPLVMQGGHESGRFEAANVTFGSERIPGFTQGDIRLIPKLQVLALDGGLFSAAVVPTVIIPSAGGAAYAGEAGVVFAPSLAMSSRVLFVHLAFDVGYRLRQRTAIRTLIVDDEAFFKVGGAFDVNMGRGTPVELVVEAFGHTPADNPFGLGSKSERRRFQSVRTAIEVDAGIRLRLLGVLLATVGIGGGAWPGYGAPAPRVFASLGLATGAGGRDDDQDTVTDRRDQCPDRPEDLDGFQDEDGCPDQDNDADSVLDEDDQCPLEAEDKDEYEDHDGCPDPDNDGDGVADADDTCPSDAEDKDGHKDGDGCPDPDNDEDGVLDADDSCPTEAEDKDGFDDADGCPDPDNDADGLPDLNDLCPSKPETYNGFKDDDGCPDARKAKSYVKVTLEKIEIKKKIQFKTGEAVIEKPSLSVLDQVVSVMRNYERIKKVRVEGHTDAEGSKTANMKLSRQRAEAVAAYLVSQGIDRSRLEPVGYGPDKPVASNRTRRGRDANRRVEFVIAEQEQQIIKAVEPGADPGGTPGAEPSDKGEKEGGKEADVEFDF